MLCGSTMRQIVNEGSCIGFCWTRMYTLMILRALDIVMRKTVD